MRQEDALGVARRRVAVEREGRVVGKLDGAIGEGADAQLGALQVGQDGDRTADPVLDGADTPHHGPHEVVVGVAHVDAENVGPSLVQGCDLIFFR